MGFTKAEAEAIRTKVEVTLRKSGWLRVEVKATRMGGTVSWMRLFLTVPLVYLGKVEQVTATVRVRKGQTFFNLQQDAYDTLARATGDAMRKLENTVELEKTLAARDAAAAAYAQKHGAPPPTNIVLHGLGLSVEGVDYAKGLCHLHLMKEVTLEKLRELQAVEKKQGGGR